MVPLVDSCRSLRSLRMSDVGDEDPGDEPGDASGEADHFFRLQREAAYESLPDGLLSMLVELANDNDLSMNITIYVRGVCATGQLVGAARYLGELSDQMSSAGGQVADVFAEAFRDMSLTSQLAGIRDPVDVPLQEHPNYVHLLRARVHIGGDFMNVEMFRARLARVDAWHLGALE